MFHAEAPRILLAPTGTLGDVYPFIAVAQALRAIGCAPVIAAIDEYRDAVTAAGIAFAPVRPGRAEWQADGLDEATIARAVAQDQRAAFAFMTPHLDATVADLTEAAAGCAAVVGGSMSVVARIVAEAAGLPTATLILQPMGFLSCTDPPVLPEAPWLATIGRRCGRAATAALYEVGTLRARTTMRPLAQLRRRLGLPSRRDELRVDTRPGDRLISMYSPSFAPIPRDAPAGTVAAGFPFYNGEAAGLSADLLRFLDAGPAPLVFTLGSFVVHAPSDFYAAGAAVARRLDRRAVLLVGQQGLERHAALAGPDVVVTAAAPHAALFPRAAAVVHHGGIGTIAQALRAGLPQLVCPFFGDQFDNAAHLERLGLGATLPLAHVTADEMEALLGPLLSSSARDRARVIAHGLDGNGPAAAAASIAALATHAREEVVRPLRYWRRR